MTAKMGKRALFGLFGAGGFGREVMPFALASYRRALDDAELAAEVCFVEREPTVSHINGYAVLSEEAFFEASADRKHFNVALGDPRLRRQIAERCIARRVEPLTLRAPSHVCNDANVLGPGAVLCDFSMITSNARIGRFFHANIYSYVAHDCVIGDFVTFAPGVKCNGNVHIGDHAYVGTGAILRDGTREKPLVIGAGAVVGMGAVVVKNVAPGATVVGNPARAFARDA